MPQLTIHIPDGKVSFFMELVRNLGFIEIEGLPNNILSEAQIKLVNIEREKVKEDPDYLINWHDARKTLKLD